MFDTKLRYMGAEYFFVKLNKLKRIMKMHDAIMLISEMNTKCYDSGIDMEKSIVDN